MPPLKIGAHVSFPEMYNFRHKKVQRELFHGSQSILNSLNGQQVVLHLSYTLGKSPRKH